MDTAWRFRLVLIMTFAIIIFGDMLGYANVKGDKNANQRNVDTTQKKKNPNQSQHQQNIEGMCDVCLYIFLLMIAHSFMTSEYYGYSNLWKTNSSRLDIVYRKHRFFCKG